LQVFLEGSNPSECTSRTKNVEKEGKRRKNAEKGGILPSLIISVPLLQPSYVLKIDKRAL